MLQNALSTGEGERRALGEQPKFELAAFALPPPSQRRKTQACTDTLAEPRVGSSPTGVAARQDLQHALGGGESGWRSGVTSTHTRHGDAQGSDSPSPAVSVVHVFILAVFAESPKNTVFGSARGKERRGPFGENCI